MRIGELSRRTGVPVPTIKYYVREGLLPPGELTSPNQAAYGETHERRLRLIRALLDVGGLKVAEIADVLAAVDDPERQLHTVLGAAAERVGITHSEHDDAESAAAQAVVADLISRTQQAAPHQRDTKRVERIAAAENRIDSFRLPAMTFDGND